MAIAINFLTINVNAAHQEGTVSIGEANQAGWSAHSKNNFGNGLFLGASFTVNNASVITDPDVIDSPINDSDNVPSAQNQQL